MRLLDDGQVLVTWFGGGDWVNVVRNGERLSTVPIRDEGPQFTDPQPPGGATVYGVGEGDFGGLSGETRICGTVWTDANRPSGPPVTPVTQCGVTVAAEYWQNAEVEIGWSGAERATEYIVWNNGRQIHTTSDSSYTLPDPYDGVATQHFAVSAKKGDDITPKHYCGKLVPEDLIEEVIPPTAPASCSLERGEDGEVDLEWGYTPNDTFVVWRNGQIVHLQVEREGRSWSDDTPPLGTVHYSVSGQSFGETSAKRYCGSTQVTELAQPVCSVTRDQSSGTLTVGWERVDDSNEVIVRRTVNDSPWYWRARVGDGSHNFVDTDRNGTIRYQIALRDSGGRVGPAIMCTMN